MTEMIPENDLIKAPSWLSTKLNDFVRKFYLCQIQYLSNNGLLLKWRVFEQTVTSTPFLPTEVELLETSI